jgi:hypothetical protein
MLDLEPSANRLGGEFQRQQKWTLLNYDRGCEWFALGGFGASIFSS